MAVESLQPLAWRLFLAQFTGRRGEQAFTDWVIEEAHHGGWLAYHARPALAKSGRYSTALQGDKGSPDLLLARDGVVILAELKQVGSYPDPAQRAWGEHIGAVYRLWRPTDRDAILAELAR